MDSGLLVSQFSGLLDARIGGGAFRQHPLHPISSSRPWKIERKKESIVVLDTDQCRSGPMPCILQRAYLDHGFSSQSEAYA